MQSLWTWRKTMVKKTKVKRREAEPFRKVAWNCGQQNKNETHRRRNFAKCWWYIPCFWNPTNPPLKDFYITARSISCSLWTKRQVLRIQWRSLWRAVFCHCTVHTFLARCGSKFLPLCTASKTIFSDTLVHWDKVKKIGISWVCLDWDPFLYVFGNVLIFSKT
jgi:hypothetical protein